MFDLDELVVVICCYDLSCCFDVGCFGDVLVVIWVFGFEVVGV